MGKKPKKAHKPNKHHKKSDKDDQKQKYINGGTKNNLYDEDSFPASDPITKY